MSNYNNNNENNTKVNAPYHFVPLSKWVYMPDWAHLVSHDVPFEDGCSGVLDYTLTNATPLCVGGEQVQKKGAATVVKWARDPHGNPVIPGSSLKGMIRSVLEIASFGKFSAVDNNHFSYRDISSKSAYLDMLKQKAVSAAWLKFDDVKQSWTLSKCDFVKINHKEIKHTFSKTIKNSDKAVDKYGKWPLNKELLIDISKEKGVQKNRWAEGLGKGSVSANIVFCNERIIGQGDKKDYEFSYCFYNKSDKAKVERDELSTVVDKFFTSHDEEQVKYLQNNQSSEHGIPVFALFEKNSNKLHSLGLAKMPRVLYNNSVHDLANYHQGKARDNQAFFDVGELIFGTLRDKGLSLKSRVSFTDSTLTSKANLMHSKNVVLSSPKATFLGAYLEQGGSGSYQDYNDKQAEVSGWKRYITQENFKENDPASNNSTGQNLDVQSQLELMDGGSEFSGKIVFHNLKKVELGALIWAIQLGNLDQSYDTYHSLGHGKSLGAGAVQLTINPDFTATTNSAETTPFDAQSCVELFIKNMERAYPGSKSTSWETSTQIKHLQALAGLEAEHDREIKHHTLEDFKKFKNNKSSLSPVVQGFEDISRSENGNFTDPAPLSFNKGRLASLIVSESDKTWHDDISQKQELLAKKQVLIDQKEQASLISNPNDKVIAELELISSQFTEGLTRTQRKEATKSFRLVMKEVKNLAWEADQVVVMQSMLEAITIDEKTKLAKWLSNVNE